MQRQIRFLTVQLVSRLKTSRTSSCSFSNCFHYSNTTQTQNGEVQNFNSGLPLASPTSPKLCNLSSRSVIKFEGPDTISFLQGLVTNDMKLLQGVPHEDPQEAGPHTRPKAMYAAILSPQGRFLYDVFFYKCTHNKNVPPVLIADVDANMEDELLKLLKRHRLRAKVNFSSCSNELSVWVKFGELPTNERADSGATSEFWHTDPRLSDLGLRGIFEKDYGILSEDTPAELTNMDTFCEWRYSLGVPEGSSEIPKGEALPLEYNLDELKAISFDKGCYVGQELTARTYHRGVIRKRLFPVRFTPQTEGCAKPFIGSEVLDTTTSKKVGKVTAVNGLQGLAHLRLESALNPDTTLQTGSDDFKVIPAKPQWWPSSWTQ